ncbi:MAG: hypothetical protein CMG62_09965 [Candidatus Marinimicrobia bacterium]|nr:hypothetical protein [Candidatus Neomarinimicrobiota bacterium]|tara:strand:+ start:1202 stop:3130 length:1929 start_codon:yes stop_codon:yes gene_type:complete
MKLFKIIFIVIIGANQLLLSQTYQELQRLQDEYKKALERQSLQKPPDISNAENTAKSIALPDKLVYSRKDIESLLVNTEKLLKKLKFYEDSTEIMPYIGYDFFTQRDTIPFWQNLPISKNYTLGPGDEVVIALWGESNEYNSEIINRDGQIFIEKIGILNLGGKTLTEAKKYLISKYSRVYSTLLGQNPKSFIDLTLGELKSINIHFVGFVNIPGVHMVHPFSNVITGLIQAGGVNTNGTLRDIQIIRNNKTINSTDIYDYIIKGKFVADIRLMDQDIVYIPSRKSTIPITGQVLKPGYYELLDNEYLTDLISFSGGLNRRSSKSIFVYKNKIANKDGYMIDFNKISNFIISNGDSIYVPKEPDFNYFVNLQGQVKNPGEYPYNKNLQIKDLLNATMSSDDQDFYQTMDLSKILIHRKNPNGNKPLKIITDINQNISLENGDYITVPKKNIFQPIESVIVTGEIAIPGVYPVNNLTSLEDILSFSGGFTNLALKDGIEIFRDSLKIAWDDNSFILKNGDSLNVLKRTGLVLVDGEVNVPGYVSYKKNDSAKKYIKRAGGFSSFAEKKNVYIIYPNGTSIPISAWSSPKVKEGSIIIVNQRTISGKEDLSGWQAFSMASNQAGNIVATLLSLSLIINQRNNGQ